MTDTEITALAREYAEAMCPVGDYCGGVYDEERNSDLPIYKDEAKSVLQWLTDRYCIVEKSKLDNMITQAKEDDIVVLVGSEVKELFPELFKDKEK